MRPSHHSSWRPDISNLQNNTGISVERTDFVGVPVRDIERAVQFYGETLGIERNPRAHQSWPEFETGNVTLGIMVPEAIGREFAPNPWPIALRCRTS